MLHQNEKREYSCAASDYFDVIVVGAGFAGMYMLHKARGMGLNARVFEIGKGVGGTWYWNRYPGARCDVESVQYSYQFDEDLEQEWTWSEKYSTQPEILEYANHVADRFDLRKDIQFQTRVVSATYREKDGNWLVKTDGDEIIRSRFCVFATGCLSSSNLPKFKGLDNYKGISYHTGHWPHEGVDFSGLKVGIIGTGSSAIQSIPEIAKQAEHLTVFQRTANYTIPARNTELSDEYVAAVKADYASLRERAKNKPAGYDIPLNPQSVLDTSPQESRAEFQQRWERGGTQFLGAYGDLLLKYEANEVAANFVKDKIREVVLDPEVADLLCPTNIIGCKRLCVDTDYYVTYNRSNVQLVDVSKKPIDRINSEGLLHDGVNYKFDAIVFATGFDAMTGALSKIDIRGKDACPLLEKWKEGPQTYLGLTTHGFPNMFMITGPGSPSVLTNMLPSIEQHVDFISDCILYLDEKGHSTIEPDLAAEIAWGTHVNEVADLSLRSTCASWYIGANVPGKPKVFTPYIGGFPRYLERCKEIVENDYEGFVLD
ncbi:MAG: cyclohexanone monooxygenase [Rhodospirillaceae bacterium]|nr:cyclohexanone monooxygenase [Rhodospirillaceae bacterium]|tara:strand:+ start:1267 stop:2895 length:1629 start_codon:yes stop_codon:yes gene_type:complete